MEKYFLTVIGSILTMYLVFIGSVYWEHRKGGDPGGAVEEGKG
jgi:hypothetical protein